MDPNRLHLNFPRPQGNGGQGHETDRTYDAANQRVYPTTPSTFPQPVFQSMPAGQGHQEYLNAQTHTAGGNYGGQQNYFGGNQNPQYQQQTQQAQQQQYGQQQQGQYSNYQQQQQNFASNQAYTGHGYGANDPNAGLAHQFSNQNLGGNQQRQQSPFGRQPTPTSQTQQQQGRSGTGGGQQYGSLLSPSGSSGSLQPNPDEKPPEQDFDKYSSNVAKRVIGLHVHVQAFFKDNITRARERNTR